MHTSESDLTRREEAATATTAAGATDATKAADAQPTPVTVPGGFAPGARHVVTGKRVSPERREALIREADVQTRAIMNLEVWKRIAYSLLAVGALLAYWNIYQGGPAWALVVGMSTFVLSALASVMLYMVVERGKANVRTMMMAAGVSLERPSGTKKK
ncbi:hypothetical protein [Olsenella sp. HMSC062G07]|uniref:hypothetical protein n=1 Tax=Olsenella sp. HMSC062G07 TaxID=1739330 RepID=UPI0008A35F6B|nr:hypothetical protein [Olsenella sp. HMSC062G07]OFK23682.1 hypothetical protein HMPREF2826_04075 [Olsenella sp. HMSC062G07]